MHKAKKPIVVEIREYHWLTPDRWDDFEESFGAKRCMRGLMAAAAIFTGER